MTFVRKIVFFNGSFWPASQNLGRQFRSPFKHKLLQITVDGTQTIGEICDMIILQGDLDARVVCITQ